MLHRSVSSDRALKKICEVGAKLRLPFTLNQQMALAAGHSALAKDILARNFILNTETRQEKIRFSSMLPVGNILENTY